MIETEIIEEMIAEVAEMTEEMTEIETGDIDLGHRGIQEGEMATETCEQEEILGEIGKEIREEVTEQETDQEEEEKTGTEVHIPFFFPLSKLTSSIKTTGPAITSVEIEVAAAVHVENESESVSSNEKTLNPKSNLLSE